jgi:type II secretory pathway component PulF
MAMQALPYQPSPARSAPSDDGFDGLAKRGSLTFAAIVIGGMLIAALWMVVGPVSPVSVLLLGVCVAEMMRNIRLRREMVVLGYLEQAVRLNLPLPQMIDAAAQSETGRIRLCLLKLADSLMAGVPLEVALSLDVPEVSRRTLALLGAGRRSGEVPATLRRALDERRAKDAGDPASRIFLKVYPVAMACAAIAVISIIMVFVLPKMEMLCRDFRIPVPAVTRALSHVWYDVFFWLAPLAAIVFVLCLGSSLLSIVAPSRKGRIWGLRDYLAWRTPLLGRMIRDRDLADACHILADAVAAGHGMDMALAQVRELRINRVLLGRIQAWHELVQRGVAVGEAATSAGLPPLVSGLLASARGQKNTADALRFLARYFALRHQRTAALLRGAAVPAVVLMFGAIVLFAALGMFMPMIAMMNHLMPDSGVL